MLRVPSLAFSRPLVLDGPTGTELERRGYETRLPLWTATAPVDVPDLLHAIHRDYVTAGADILTASTFRTTAHTLDKAGRAKEARALTRAAVQIARDAAHSAPRSVLVAGSVAPLEDCYFPDRTPHDAVLRKEHDAHVEALVAAGVDLLLVETMPTRREAVIAARAAKAAGLPVVVSLLATDSGDLFDGDSLDATLAELAALSVNALAVNCCSVAACTASMRSLSHFGVPFGAYANAGVPDGTFGFEPIPIERDTYANAARSWLEAGALLVGSCCGTGPEHTSRLRELVDAWCARPDEEKTT